SASLTSNIVTSRYIHDLLLRPRRGPKGEACTRGQAGGKGFEKLQSRGGKGFEKLSRKGSLGFENRQPHERAGAKLAATVEMAKSRLVKGFVLLRQARAAGGMVSGNEEISRSLRSVGYRSTEIRALCESRNLNGAAN